MKIGDSIFIQKSVKSRAAISVCVCVREREGALSSCSTVNWYVRGPSVLNVNGMLRIQMFSNSWHLILRLHLVCSAIFPCFLLSFLF